jgi:hypothetical protein
MTYGAPLLPRHGQPLTSSGAARTVTGASPSWNIFMTLLFHNILIQKARNFLDHALMTFFRGFLRLRHGGLRRAGSGPWRGLFCRCRLGWLRGLCGGPAFISDPSASISDPSASPAQGGTQNGPGARGCGPGEGRFANHFLIEHGLLDAASGKRPKWRKGILFRGRQRVLMHRPLETCQNLSRGGPLLKKFSRRLAPFDGMT